MDETTKSTTKVYRTKEAAIAAWYQEVEQLASKELGYGVAIREILDDETWEWLREEMTPAEAVAWSFATPDHVEEFDPIEELTASGTSRNYERELIDWM